MVVGEVNPVGGERQTVLKALNILVVVWRADVVCLCCLRCLLLVVVGDKGSTHTKTLS